MAIQSLSINLTKMTNYGTLICDGKCPQCIAKATWKTGVPNNDLISLNLSKALNYAKLHGVDTVVFTGSVEPCICSELISLVCRVKDAGIPSIEIQTNGYKISQDNYDLLKKLKQAGLTTVAISVNHIDPIENNRRMGFKDNSYNYKNLLTKIKSLGGILGRVSFNLTKGSFFEDRLSMLGLEEGMSFPEQFVEQHFVPWAKEMSAIGAHQLTLRTMGKALNPLNTDEARAVGQWVDDNPFPEDYRLAIFNYIQNGKFPRLRRLYYGPYVYSFFGMTIVGTTCKQEENSKRKRNSWYHTPARWECPS